MWDKISQVALNKDCHFGLWGFSVSNSGHDKMKLHESSMTKTKTSVGSLYRAGGNTWV